MKTILRLVILVIAGLSYSSTVRGALAVENKITPGEFIVDPPTLINLGFEWFVDGDDNRNATVAIQYRKVGEAQWKQAFAITPAWRRDL